MDRTYKTSLAGTLHGSGLRLTAMLVVAVFIASQVTTLKAFGLAWDEGLGNLFFGERYSYYWQTFQQKYLDFRTELSYHRDTPVNTYLSPFREYPYEFPGFWDTVSAGSMRLLGYRWEWLDPVDAFHLPTVLLTGAFLWLFFAWVERRCGGLPALLALVMLASFPRLWADAHFNIKDVPQMAFFGLAVMAYADWYATPSWRRAILTGMTAGMALAVKANALFLPFVMILGLWQLSPPASAFRSLIEHIRKTWGMYLAMAALVAGFYWLSWPFLHADPARALDYFRYIASQGSREGAHGLTIQPVHMLLAVLPEGMLALLLVGVAAGLAVQLRSVNPTLRLAMAWLFVPLARISLPGSANFDGVRHFLEILPAVALLAGWAGGWLVELASRKGALARAGMLVLLVLLIALPASNAWQRYGVYQHVYFNRLAGGQARAAQIFGESEAADYWGVTYRAGMNWLNDNAGADSLLAVAVAPWLVELAAPLWLRPDIKVVPLDQLAANGSERYLMLITNSGARAEALGARCMDDPQPVFSIRVDGHAIMQVCRLDPGG